MRKNFRKYRRFKKRKSVLKSRLFWNFILIFILAISVFYFSFLSEIFKIKEIKISAPENIPQNEIQALLEKELKTPFFYFFHKNTFLLVSSERIEKGIQERYPEIKQANLKKKFPRTLILEIKTRVAAGIWCFNESNCFLIDKDGTMFRGPTSKQDLGGDLAVIFSENKGVKNLGEQVISREKINRLLEIDNKLEKDLEIAVEKFTLIGENRLDVKTVKGWEIYFDLSSDINLDLTKLQLLLEKEISPEARENLRYIDLRFSKVYYK